MIRINLLPFRLERKKENIRKQISIFCLLIFLILVLLFWGTQYMTRQIAEIQAQTEQVNHQISKYKEKANRVTKIQNNLKILEKKIILVESLKDQRDKQLILFDSMTQLVVPERMWINSLSSGKNSLRLRGIAFDNQTIAEFMKKLEASPLFTNVDLKTAKLKKFKGNNDLKEFELVCKKRMPEKSKNKKTKQGKK